MSDHHVCSDAAFLSCLEGFELVPHIVRALAQGQPVATQEIAASANLPKADVERLLRSQPGTEWDHDGRSVGFGLAPQATEHRFIVGGKTLYTWCATDTLLFTVILGASTVVESTCPSTGELIRIELTPDAIVSVTPEEAVVSQRNHDVLLPDIRADICDHGHFFSSPIAAKTWAAEHPEGQVLSVADAFDHGRAACIELGLARTVTSR